MRHVIVYSGGMDSYTLLHYALAKIKYNDTLVAVSFDYGQRHKKELLFAGIECARLGIHHEIIQLPALNNVRSALTSPDMPVPEGHYEAESMKQTVVPGRNTVMLAMALAYAQSDLLLPELSPNEDPVDRRPDDDEEEEADIVRARVYIGVHSGDHHIYPDCRPHYIRAMMRVFVEATEGQVSLLAPFLNLSKGVIAAIGRERGLDYGRAWTCYKGEEKPCGKCGACVERAEAMEYAGIADPLLA